MTRPFFTRRRIAVVAAVVMAAGALLAVGVVTATGSSDNDIPGIELPDSPFSGSLNDYSDFDDVYAVPLKVNQKLEVTMQGDEDSRYDLWLWAPWSKSIFTDSPLTRVLQSSQNTGTSTEYFWYPARYTGTYYLHVFNPLDTSDSSNGSYDIEYEITQLTAPTIWVTAPASVGRGKSAKIHGGVSFKGEAFAGARVLIQSKAAGSTTWTDVNFDSANYRPKAVTDSAGHYSYTVKPSKRTQYRVTVWPTEDTGWRFGPTLTIAPRVKLGTPHAPSTAKKNQKFTVYGYLAPRHSTGAKTVTLTFTKGERTVRVKATNYKYSSKKWGKATKYRVRVKLPSKGTWKVVASTKPSTKYSATTSGADYVKVK